MNLGKNQVLVKFKCLMSKLKEKKIKKLLQIKSDINRESLLAINYILFLFEHTSAYAWWAHMHRFLSVRQ